MSSSSCKSYLFFDSSDLLIAISLLPPQLQRLTAHSIHLHMNATILTLLTLPSMKHSFLSSSNKYHAAVLSFLQKNSRMHYLSHTSSFCATCFLLASKLKSSMNSTHTQFTFFIKPWFFFPIIRVSLALPQKTTFCPGSSCETFILLPFYLGSLSSARRSPVQ